MTALQGDIILARYLVFTIFTLTRYKLGVIFLDNIVNLFDSDIDQCKDHADQINTLKAKIGQFTMENVFLAKGAQTISQPERKTKTNSTYDLPATHLYLLLPVSCSSTNYKAKVLTD